MIEYPDFQFAAPPRTGSTWFVKACYLAGFGEKQRTHSHAPPPIDYNGFVVSLVRNPTDWLVSYFMTLEGGKVGVPQVDILSNCYVPGDLLLSIRKFLKMPKNILSTMFDRYQANTVMKLEDFPWAPLEFFMSLGYKEKDDQIRKMPAQNVRYGIAYSVSWEIRQRIIEHEKDMCERYDYVI